MFRSDHAGRLFAGLLLAVLLAGCTTTSGPTTSGGKEPASAVRKDRRPATVEMRDTGFTVSEVVRIDSDVRRDYQQAIFLLEAGRFEEGAGLLESVVEQAPEVTIPHIDLGVAYARLGDYEKAESALRAALSLAPNHPAALNELGILQRRTGRFSAARASYERALAIHPGFHFALLNLGVLCDLYLEDLACAHASYTKYAEIVVDDPRLDIWIADIESRLKQAGGG